MFIKASGARLDAVAGRRGISVVGRRTLRRSLERVFRMKRGAEKAYAGALAASVDKKCGLARPSMEAGMHALLPKKYVLHLHSLPALLMAHEARRDKNWIAWLRKKWGSDFVILPPISPGLLLSKAIQSRKNASLFILENHGALLQSNTASILKKWAKLEADFCRAMNVEQREFNRIDPKESAPLRLYFPDSAVFFRRIRDLLSPVGRRHGEVLFRSKPGARKKDRDAYEIWWASRALYRICPALKAIPASLGKRIAGLPTEKYRRLTAAVR